MARFPVLFKGRVKTSRVRSGRVGSGEGDPTQPVRLKKNPDATRMTREEPWRFSTPPFRAHPTHLASDHRSHARVAGSTPDSSFPRSFREVGDRQADLPQLFEGEIKLSDHFR